jgi:hypothetical protein
MYRRKFPDVVILNMKKKKNEIYSKELQTRYRVEIPNAISTV